MYDSHRILVVEDHNINQKVIKNILERYGFQIDIANNGVEAIEAIRRHDYALIFMDCQMPVMDGYEATRQIRADEQEWQHTPVIALTANALQGDRERCLAAGMDDYLTKPLDLAEIQQKLTEWLPERSGQSDPVLGKLGTDD